MGKKNRSSSTLGRALINDRFGRSNTGRRSKDPSVLHTSEVADGYDWGRLNLRSVTEESSFQEFLSTAQLAETEFKAEKLNIKFVNPFVRGLLSEDEIKKIKQSQSENEHNLSIPRRPKWDESTTPEELEENENAEFLEWRRRLAVLQDVKDLILTPYEKNLEFWRQLWRVVERSDIVVQIVDARNPLLFHCKDLEKYVHEVDPHKQNLILLNKADFLTSEQRTLWADYFSKQGVRVAFYSATADAIEKKEEPKDIQEQVKSLEQNLASTVIVEEGEDSDSELKEKISSDAGYGTTKDKVIEETKEMKGENVDASVSSAGISKDSMKMCPSNEKVGEEAVQCSSTTGSTFRSDELHETKTSKIADAESKGMTLVENSAKLLTQSELISFFRTLHSGPKVTPDVTTVGLVGYPNVGKSSTINSLLMEKKVSVSATPGKTKHFQTLYLDKDLLLCDCPGLVMPSFVYSKAEMVINGILSIDQMRDHVPPVQLVCSLMPRHILEDTYGIMIPLPPEGDDPDRPPTSEELLNSYGYNRGFMTQNGQPDNPRSSRYVLKDYVNGKLLYCHAPPGYSQNEFHKFPEQRKQSAPETTPLGKKGKVSSASLDSMFFAKSTQGVHTKGRVAKPGVPGIADAGQSKPWKDHSHKRNKREKLRRVYSHLDE